MMEQEIAREENLFTKGFNSGYYLSKYQPEMLEDILKAIDKKNDHTQGLADGKKEFEKEKIRDRINLTTRDKGKSRER